MKMAANVINNQWNNGNSKCNRIIMAYVCQ
jgi:hypothetical protein